MPAMSMSLGTHPNRGQGGREPARVGGPLDGRGQDLCPEKPASDEATGVCGCCGLRALSDRKGNVYLLYRSAAEQVNRDTYLLISKDQGRQFQSDRLQK